MPPKSTDDTSAQEADFKAGNKGLKAPPGIQKDDVMFTCDVCGRLITVFLFRSTKQHLDVCNVCRHVADQHGGRVTVAGGKKELDFNKDPLYFLCRVPPIPAKNLKNPEHGKPDPDEIKPGTLRAQSQRLSVGTYIHIDAVDDKAESTSPKRKSEKVEQPAATAAPASDKKRARSTPAKAAATKATPKRSPAVAAPSSTRGRASARVTAVTREKSPTSDTEAPPKSRARKPSPKLTAKQPPSPGSSPVMKMALESVAEAPKVAASPSLAAMMMAKRGPASPAMGEASKGQQVTPKPSQPVVAQYGATPLASQNSAKSNSMAYLAGSSDDDSSEDELAKKLQRREKTKPAAKKGKAGAAAAAKKGGAPVPPAATAEPPKPSSAAVEESKQPKAAVAPKAVAAPAPAPIPVVAEPEANGSFASTTVSTEGAPARSSPPLKPASSSAVPQPSPSPQQPTAPSEPPVVAHNPAMPTKIPAIVPAPLPPSEAATGTTATAAGSGDEVSDMVAYFRGFRPRYKTSNEDLDIYNRSLKLDVDRDLMGVEVNCGKGVGVNNGHTQTFVSQYMTVLSASVVPTTDGSEWVSLACMEDVKCRLALWKYDRAEGKFAFQHAISLGTNCGVQGVSWVPLPLQNSETNLLGFISIIRGGLVLNAAVCEREPLKIIAPMLVGVKKLPDEGGSPNNTVVDVRWTSDVRTKAKTVLVAMWKSGKMVVLRPDYNMPKAFTMIPVFTFAPKDDTIIPIGLKSPPTSYKFEEDGTMIVVQASGNTLRLFALSSAKTRSVGHVSTNETVTAVCFHEGAVAFATVDRNLHILENAADTPKPLMSVSTTVITMESMGKNGLLLGTNNGQIQIALPKKSRSELSGVLHAQRLEVNDTREIPRSLRMMNPLTEPLKLKHAFNANTDVEVTMPVNISVWPRLPFESSRPRLGDNNAEGASPLPVLMWFKDGVVVRRDVVVE